MASSFNHDSCIPEHCNYRPSGVLDFDLAQGWIGDIASTVTCDITDLINPHIRQIDATLDQNACRHISIKIIFGCGTLLIVFITQLHHHTFITHQRYNRGGVVPDNDISLDLNRSISVGIGYIIGQQIRANF